MNKSKIAAWALIAIALILTLVAMLMGVEMLSAISAILTAIWTAALGLVGFAYRDLVTQSEAKKKAQQ